MLDSPVPAAAPAPPAAPIAPNAAARSGAVPTLAAPAGLVLLLVAVAVTLRAGIPNEAGWRLLGCLGGCWAVFALAALALLRTPVRVAVPLLVVGAVALQVLAVSVGPRMTDDYFRYVWDGRVQAAGVDPYRYAPVDPALARLRDDWLFPPACRGAVPAPCTRMNHPTVPTIYPPLAQAAFWLLHVLTSPLGPDGGGARSVQVAAALVALATTGALLRVLASVGGDPRRAVLWAWCPTVVLEAGNNAHVDVLAALLVVLGAGWCARGRPVRAGLALGAAVATKLVPLLVLPAMLAPVGRNLRRPLTRAATRLTFAAAGVVVVGYLPHLLAVGPRAAGFLPGYLDEEGYDGRGRFALLRLVLPGPAAAVAAVGILAAVALWAAGRSDPRRPWLAATVLTGTALALGGVTYPWYALLLVALVALGGRAEWLLIAAAGYPGYFAAALHVPYAAAQQLGCGLALAVVALVALARRRWPAHERPATARGPVPLSP